MAKGAVIPAAVVAARIKEMGIPPREAAARCGISRTIMRWYMTGRSPAYARRLSPLFGGAYPPGMLAPQMQPKERARKAAQLAELVRGRQHLFPAEWQADIDGMLRRLDAQANMEVPQCPTQT